MRLLQNVLLFFSLYSFVFGAAAISDNLLLLSDALSLLSFKSKADVNNHLPFSLNTSFAFCKWRGLQCRNGRLVRVVLESLRLGGVFEPDTLTRLDQLRVLSLQNNSLVGPIPDLSPLSNLKSIFLDHNYFTGSIPPSISTLHRLRTLDLSHNNLTALIPHSLNNLARLYYLRLDSNCFTGSVPSLNQSSLRILNVSVNNLSGAIPVTPTLLRFQPSSFQQNPRLCGEIVKRECTPPLHFFGSPLMAEAAPTPTPKAALGQNEQLRGGGAMLAHPDSTKKHKRAATAVILGSSSVFFILIGSILCFALAVKKQRSRRNRSDKGVMASAAAYVDEQAVAAVLMRIEEENEIEEKVKKAQKMRINKSGNIVFCAGETQIYTVEQLMRASAELLGKGTIGTTYKAVLDNRLIVCVKRLDANKLEETNKEMFKRHIESVGGLRHPNVVPLRAYFQANEERLLIYDYQPNGSLYSLIHGPKSKGAKPLHWTSCLKIAEDVAQGLSYIHQAWQLVHGNIKSRNVLLGSDFEACLTDYCLKALVISSSSNDDNGDDGVPVIHDGTYEAPETRRLNNVHVTETPMSDVYSFGVLLIEILSGKPPPSQTMCLMPSELINWVRSSREDDIGGDDHCLGMLLDVAIACSVITPEQRPTMWQVLKMIQEIKESLVREQI